MKESSPGAVEMHLILFQPRATVHVCASPAALVPFRITSAPDLAKAACAVKQAGSCALYTGTCVASERRRTFVYTVLGDKTWGSHAHPATDVDRIKLVRRRRVWWASQ